MPEAQNYSSTLRIYEGHVPSFSSINCRDITSGVVEELDNRDKPVEQHYEYIETDSNYHLSTTWSIIVYYSSNSWKVSGGAFQNFNR